MKDKIYIGEKFSEIVQAQTKLTVGNTTSNIYQYDNSTDNPIAVEIDTSSWVAGQYATVVNAGGTITIGSVVVEDPLASVDELSYLLSMIKEIDTIVQDRARNKASQITINNKTIVNDSIDSLLHLRNVYVNRANELKKKNKKGGLFKSITVFRG